MSRHRRKKGGPRGVPPTIALPLDELGAIVERTKAAPLSADDHAKLKAAMDTLVFVTAELQRKQTSLDRLRRLLFGAKTEKTRTILASGAVPGAPDPGASPSPAADPAAAGSPRPGHGRIGAAAYRAHPFSAANWDKSDWHCSRCFHRHSPWVTLFCLRTWATTYRP